MSDPNAPAYGRNYDGRPGDILTRLEEILASTPPTALTTRPIRRAMLQAVINEIKRLRSELSAHQNHKGD